MPYIKALDGDGNEIYLYAESGDGTTGSPYVMGQSVSLTGNLPDTAAGDLAAILAKLSSDPATQTTLALLATDISNLLESMGEQTPFSGTVNTSGDTTFIAAPGPGNRLVIDTWDIASAATVTVLLKFGATAFMTHPFDGGTDYLRWSGPVRWVLPENTAFVGNLSDAQTVNYYGLYHVETIW